MARRMSWLRTSGRDIVNEADEVVLLKGYCLGGWLNTENFINGYPFVDHAFFRALCKVLGESKAQYYYERQYEYYMREEDVELLAECGTNSVRLPFNYRIFESDAAPGEYCPAGFEYFDRLVKWCKKHGLYIILDLHAAQGWQSPGWHCDNPADICLLYESRDFRKRVGDLWRAIARRYKDEPTIAGYEIINEPEARNQEVLQGFYKEVTRKIRREDKRHIIFVEGNIYGQQFGKMKPFDKNLVFASHIYVDSDFSNAPYPNKHSNPETFAAAYRNRADGARRQAVPMWCGEFGAQHFARDPAVRKGRLQTVDDQITHFESLGHSWAMWTYKDVGVMGLATLKAGSEYMRRTAPVRRMKAKLCADWWTADWRAIGKWTRPLMRQVKNACGRRVRPQVAQQVVSDALITACSKLLVEPFAEQFRGMTKREIDRMMKSWKLENCRINRGLGRILKKHSA
ncbi:MAG: glycoside hydrolase family 5 protein [Planctomycetota bacterium]